MTDFLPGMAPGTPSAPGGDSWFTSRELLSRLPRIVLDPCWEEGCAVVAAATLDIRRGQNGLTRQWEPGPGHGIVWVNPPFSNCGEWLAKCRQESRRLAHVVVALAPAVPGDGPWHQHVWGEAQLVGFLAGRVEFFDAAGTCETKGRGHALVLYGRREACREVAEVIARGFSTSLRAPFWVAARSSAVAVQARFEV